jgi:hypothetical protein
VVKEARQHLAVLAQVGVVQTKPLVEMDNQIRVVAEEQAVAQMFLVPMQAVEVLQVDMLIV